MGMEEITIEKAEVHHAPRIAELLAQLGYPSEPGAVARRISALSASEADCLWVARFRGKAVGFLAFHIIPVFPGPENLGRITALVVDEESREKGIGRLLAATAERWAWDRECARVEVTSGDWRSRAHHFYQDLGYAMESKRFVKRKTE